MEENYPDELLRGVPLDNTEFITPEGYPTQAAFRFSKWEETKREDGFRELSINWVDDEGAVDTLLNQINVKKGKPQFQGGYCRFPKAMILAMREFISNGHLSYERSPIVANEENGFQENPYHGNILMKDGLSSQAVTIIQVTLAGLAGSVIRRA